MDARTVSYRLLTDVWPHNLLDRSFPPPNAAFFIMDLIEERTCRGYTGTLLRYGSDSGPG